MLTPQERGAAEAVSRLWWLGLITGILFLILGFIVLSYDADSLTTVAILIGVAFIFTGVVWLIGASQTPELKWWFIIGGILALIAGIITFSYPSKTLLVLGLLLGWFLLVAGVIDIIVALTHRDHDLWWLTLLQGIIMFGLGVWAAGEDDRSVFLLLTLTGVFCVIRGIGDIVNSFRLRGLKHDLRTGGV